MNKKLIRHGVFETNSSSSHSVSVADETKDFVMDYIYPNEDGVVVLEGGEFGWNWFKNNDAITKANYVVASYGLTDNLKEVIMEHTGAVDVVYETTDDYSSYVDHDSYGVAPQGKEELKNFIFNQNSWLFGGNDNATADPTFYDVTEFTKDGKEVPIVYTHELIIDGLEKKTFFKSEPNKDELEDGIHSLVNGVYLREDGSFYDDNSVMGQLSRPRNLFRMSYMGNQITEDGIMFSNENSFQKAREIWEIEYPNAEWNSPNGYAKCREIETRLLENPDSGMSKIVKYHVNKI